MRKTLCVNIKKIVLHKSSMVTVEDFFLIIFKEGNIYFMKNMLEKALDSG